MLLYLAGAAREILSAKRKFSRRQAKFSPGHAGKFSPPTRQMNSHSSRHPPKKNEKIT